MEGVHSSDDALGFFDQIYSLIPDIYRQVPREFLEPTTAPKQNNQKQNKNA